MDKRKPTIGPGWAGERYPPGSRVTFDLRDRTIEGKVVELRERYTIVAGGKDGRWHIGYGSLVIRERAHTECTLAEVQTLARQLLAQHQDEHGLDRRWTFRFDLAPIRAGQCRYDERRIYLSAGHCLKAGRETIRDTLLHEIAHALSGAGRGRTTSPSAPRGGFSRPRRGLSAAKSTTDS